MSYEKLWEQIKHFKHSEFDSPDLADSGINMNIEFIKMIDQLREICGFPFKINSGYRTEEYNKIVGGVDSSAHEKGVACDISVSNGREKYDIIRAAIELGFTRIGIGKTFVHLDMDFDLPQRVIWTYDNSRVKV